MEAHNANTALRPCSPSPSATSAPSAPQALIDTPEQPDTLLLTDHYNTAGSTLLSLNDDGSLLDLLNDVGPEDGVFIDASAPVASQPLSMNHIASPPRFKRMSGQVCAPVVNGASPAGEFDFSGLTYGGIDAFGSTFGIDKAPEVYSAPFFVQPSQQTFQLPTPGLWNPLPTDLLANDSNSLPARINMPPISSPLHVNSLDTAPAAPGPHSNPLPTQAPTVATPLPDTAGNTNAEESPHIAVYTSSTAGPNEADGLVTALADTSEVPREPTAQLKKAVAKAGSKKAAPKKAAPKNKSARPALGNCGTNGITASLSSTETIATTRVQRTSKRPAPADNGWVPQGAQKKKKAKR